MHRLTLPLNFLIVVFLTTNIFIASAQTIKGVVKDAESGKPIGNVTVYQGGTQIITSSNDLGQFTLQVKQTDIPVIFHLVGYEDYQATNYAGHDLAIVLKLKVHQLKEVSIAAEEEMSRAEKMKVFLTEFIGAKAKDCDIKNKDDIWLQYNGRTRTVLAAAEKPLQIVNRKLAYRVTFFLDTFKHQMIRNQTQYTGSYVFAEDTAGLTPADMKKVLEARTEAYLGSRMHFIRALWLNELNANNFLLYKSIFPKKGSSFKLEPQYRILAKDVVFTIDDKKFHNQQFLVLKTPVAIVYGKDKKTSSIIPMDGYEGSMIDSSGYYGSGLTWEGDMGIARVSKLLPYEYQAAGVVK